MNQVASSLRASTLVEALDRAAAAAPRAVTAFPRSGQVLTTADLAERATRAAAGFRCQGLVPGALAGLLMPVEPDLLVGLFGLFKAGATASVLPTPVAFGDSAGEVTRLSKIIAASGMRFLVADSRFDVAAAALLDEHPGLQILRVDSSAEGETAPPVPEDCAIIQFTSGTTGRPRGVTLSHSAVMAGIRAIRKSAGLTPADVLVQWVPLYHDMGLFGLLSQVLHGASTHAFEPMAFLRRPHEFLRYLAACGATVTTGPNFAYDLLCDAADRVEELDLSRWRVAFNGAEPVKPATVQRFQRTFARFGVAASTMFPVYGMAEATLAVTFPRPRTSPEIVTLDWEQLVGKHVARRVPSSAEGAKSFVCLGVPVSGVDVRIVGDDGQAVGDGAMGEIEIAGTPVTKGYYGETNVGSAAFDEGWLRTGDLGFWLDGKLYIGGRCKEMVVVGGRNYFPEDAEDAARDVDGVYHGRCVAFADADDDGTEYIAVAVEHDGDETSRRVVERSVRRAVTRALGVGAVRVYVVRPRWLTRTTSGKWERLRARQRLTSGWAAP